jgi:hypothetical protein
MLAIKDHYELYAAAGTLACALFSVKL